MKILFIILASLITCSLVAQANIVKKRINRIERDSLIGEFSYCDNCNTGVINLYGDSTSTITGIPGCYSCVVLDDCGTWRIKRNKLIIESYPKDAFIESKLLNDSCITIFNIVGNSGEVWAFKNGEIEYNNEWQNGMIRILKNDVDSIRVLNIGFHMSIYNKTGQDDYYKFRIFNRCMKEQSIYNFKILSNYALRGELSGKKVTLQKKNSVPDFKRKHLKSTLYED